MSVHNLKRIQSVSAPHLEKTIVQVLKKTILPRKTILSFYGNLAQLLANNATLTLSNSPLIHRFLMLLGISGWRSRLCTIVFGLGVYLVVSALISTRKINFPTYDPLQQFRNLPPGDSSSLVARSLNSDTETHVSTTKIHSVDSQSPALRHHHHPRNLAAAIDHVQQKR